MRLQLVTPPDGINDPADPADPPDRADRADRCSSQPGAAPGASRVLGPPAVSDAERRPLTPDAGMATAEYAIATLAACGFAGLLVAVLTSDQVRTMILSIIQRALTLA